MKRIVMIAVFLGVLALSASQAEAQYYYGYRGGYYNTYYGGFNGPSLGFTYNLPAPVYYGPRAYVPSRPYYYPPIYYAYPGYPGYAYPGYGTYGGFRTPGFSYYYGR